MILTLPVSRGDYKILYGRAFMIKKIAIATVETTAKTIVNAIPGGSIVTSVYDAVKGGCLEKRQDKWKAAIESRMSTVEKTLEDIGNNEAFTTALIKATELAMRTSLDEKVEYLANGVLHTCNVDLDEEKLIVFMDMLEKYTISHIKILIFFSNPRAYEGMDRYLNCIGSPTTPLFDIYPELENGMFKKLHSDLYYDGLLTSDNFNVTVTGAGMLAKRTSPLADEFLKFIFDKR